MYDTPQRSTPGGTVFVVPIEPGWWMAATALTGVFLFMMLRPRRYKNQGEYFIAPLLRAFWIVPILLTWLIYFAAMWAAA